MSPPPARTLTNLHLNLGIQQRLAQPLLLTLRLGQHKLLVPQTATDHLQLLVKRADSGLPFPNLLHSKGTPILTHCVTHDP